MKEDMTFLGTGIVDIRQASVAKAIPIVFRGPCATVKDHIVDTGSRSIQFVTTHCLQMECQI